MNTELTDEQLNEVWNEVLRLEWRNKSEGEWHFARAVIAADRALQDARHAEELAAYELTVANLRAAQGAEIEDMKLNLEYMHYFYGTRSARLFNWAHTNLTEELKTQYFNIVANGTIDSHEPPTYAQQLNLMRHRAEAAEAMLAAAPCAGCGETCKRAKLCATCAGEIAAAPHPSAQPELPAEWATLIHYPEHWDTAAYPTLEHAIHEALAWAECSTCKPAAQPERGQIVVTKNEAGQIVAVTRQDEDGKILEVIATDIRFERESEPKPTSFSLSKRAKLEADGYVVNGVAMMHPETGRRVLLDYCGFVGWWNGQVHHDQQAQAERKPMTRDQVDDLAEDGVFLRSVYEIVQEVEAFHGIKDTP